LDITIKNYRCFPDSAPVKFTMPNGFVAIVGVNNSGKSSLLKFFYEFRGLFLVLSDLSFWINALRGQSVGFGAFQSTFDPNEVFCNQNQRNLELSVDLTEVEAQTAGPEAITMRGVEITVPRGQPTFFLKSSPPVAGIRDPRVPLQIINETRLRRADNGVELAELRPIVEAFRLLSRTHYIPSFRNALNIGTNSNYFDIQTGQAFIARWQAIKTGNIKEDSRGISRITEAIRRIFGFRQLEINAAADNQSFQINVDHNPYKLQELGAGFTQFLVSLLNAALAKPAYVLIDEPEMGLHPSLQAEFLTTLGAFAERGTLFTTHSLGLARSSADWVYSVVRDGNGLSSVHPLESTPRLSELVGELSFEGYRELGCEKILLVEGPKDVKAIQTFLRYLDKDTKIVPISMGGSSMINAGVDAQLEEVKRLSRFVFALIDSERTLPDTPLSAERQGFLEACGRAGVKCRVLERRAFENYLTEAAIRKVKGDKYRALGPYELLRDVQPAWSKEENWRIAREMTIDDLQGTDLGEFLDSL
jgi:energy-coupling factor transporter ATP-binding protein EcfA2